MRQQEGNIIPRYPESKPLEISDLGMITSYAEKYNQLSCEFSFSNLYLWNDFYHYQLSFFNNWLIIIDTVCDYTLMPMGENINVAGLVKLSEKLKKSGYSGDISNIPPEILEANPELLLHYDIEDIREEAEYIYSAEKLFKLTGKKLRKKRNHISQFVRQYPNHQVKPMNSVIRKDCLQMVENMLVESGPVSKSIEQEAFAIKKALKSFYMIPLEGIAIYTGASHVDDENKEGYKQKGELVCFSVYSPLNKEVFTIHFEKSDYAYQGSAQMINWETAKVLKARCKYINREQDLGIEGLRKAKLSYQPELIYPANFMTFRVNNK